MGENNDSVRMKVTKVAEGILFNTEQLTNLMNKKEGFDETNGITFVKLINAYMDFVCVDTYDLAEDVFDAVNKLNSVYGVGKRYSYLDYLKKENPKISNQLIAKIICDDVYFELFELFDEYTELFNQPKEDYILALDNLAKRVKLENKQLKEIASQRLNEFVSRFNNLLVRKHAIYGEVVTMSDDPNMELSIMNKVDLNNDQFTIARNLYLVTCSDFQYEANLFDYHEDMVNKSLKWAKLYAALLNKVDIKAMVCGDAFKYVVFEVDGIWMKADATTVIEDIQGLNLNDLLRVKLGFKTVGYEPLQKDEKMIKKLIAADTKCNYKNLYLRDYKTMLAANYKNPYMEQEFKKKLGLISYYLNNNTSVGYEWMAYIKLLTDCLFNEQEKEAYCVYVAMLNNESKYEPCIIVSVKQGEEWMYLYLLKNRPIKQIFTSSLENMLNNDSVKIIGQGETIKGLEEKYDLALKKKMKSN